MPEEKLIINGGSADLSGPDQATKDKISESVLARVKRELRETQKKVKENFLTSPEKNLYSNLKDSRAKGLSDDQKNFLTTPEKGFNSNFKDSRSEREKEESFLRKTLKKPLATARQTASFQANKNKILQEGLGKINNIPNLSNKEENVDRGVSKDNFSDGENKDAQAESNLKAGKKKVKGKQVVSAKVTQEGGSKISGIRSVTDAFLKKAWELSLESYTLSVFYVYIHVFLHQNFPKYFCELGQEWVPSKIKKIDPEKAQKIGKKIGMIEKPGAGCCCVFHLVVIMLIYTIIYFMIHWGEVAWNWFKGLFS
ncbi:MAG: hypothetical protein PHP37_03250 [Patescibacteria group bacterium]|nr:hypothetical protein [Patescibacteria group bacterium]